MEISKIRKKTNRIKYFLFYPSINEQRILVIFFGLIGFILPMIYGYIDGFPVPHVHDEFNYLLAADTFAHGRITNPTPAFYEHFESPHILVKPTYMSKYPPMQGLFLAAGQIFFGHPIFGVWLSCGVMGASLFWMLMAWTRWTWAIVGTFLMIFFIGIDGYWAQSYWGGMAAAAGGALFFGGFRRLTKKRFLLGSTLLMTLGGIILVNSRPFEGTVMMIPALLLLLFQLLCKSNISFNQKLTRIILPGAFVTCLALSAMAYYNYTITGNALRFPYTDHQNQYFSTPLFIFQSSSESKLAGHERLKKLYKLLNTSRVSLRLAEYNLPDNKYLSPIYVLILLFLILPYLLLMPPLMLFLFLGSFPLMTKSRWMQFIFISILFTFCCMSFATYWDYAHYSASLTCCFYLIIVQVLRILINFCRNKKKDVVSLFLILLFVSASVTYKFIFSNEWFLDVVISSTHSEISNLDIDLNKTNIIHDEMHVSRFATDVKPLIEMKIKENIAQSLILVSYKPDYSVHDEVVFNEADIESSKLIWAYDLDEERNKDLLNYYKDRKIFKVKIQNSNFVIEPYN